MRSARWLAGLVARRPVELLVAALSIAVAVALIASLGTFVDRSHAALTVRAGRSVPVDWQIQRTAQGSTAAVDRAVRHLPDVRRVERVSMARVPGFRAGGAAGVRQTGAGYVVSISPGYRTTFPGELRHLVGRQEGAQLFQQTAANLAASPGSRISVLNGSGARPVTVRGIVDMPVEDSFFQVVGLAPGTGASAPPDNVLLVPASAFTSLVGSRPVVQQWHVGFRHDTLPADPQAAALAVEARAHHFQAAVTGGALVGDNLDTALTAAGGDARYADLLFLLLGLPGLALACVVAALVVALRGERRRREVALLRLRGATGADVVRLSSAEAVATAAMGAALGVPAALLAVRVALHATSLSLPWTVAAGVGGLALAFATQIGPVLRSPWTREPVTVAGEAARSSSDRAPWPLRAGLDVVLLVAAALSFALTARGGYQVVLASEGIPQTQVDHGALAGPALAWPGLALLVWRVTRWTTGRRTGRWSRATPGRAPELEAAALRHRRGVIARGAAGLAVALGLAVSTAIFTSTYQAQARVDVALTVGSDVAVVEPASAHVGPGAARAIASAPGVRHVEPMLHRFAYVGPDLQDLYGVRPGSFGSVTALQDAFVPGSTVKQALAALRHTPDGVLVSAETLHDYQLHPGDRIRLRLQTGRDLAYRPVDFHVVGQVAEWPTAPKDSFVVANAGYLTRMTGAADVGAFLVSTPDPAATAAGLRTRLLHSGSTAQVQDIRSAAASVTSATGLAATDLSGLSRLELGFGVVLALACSGLALAGGILERRRALVLLAALGATPRQRGRFLASEARTLVVSGVIGGGLVGVTIAYLLVKVLTGIFDPPPDTASVPWTYLVLLLGLVAGLTVLVVAGVGRLAARAGPRELRDL